MVEMNGKLLRDKKIIELKERLNTIDNQLGLAVIQVGDNEASKVYVGQKEKLANELGYKFIHKVFDKDIKQEELIQCIEKLNTDESIDGILVQMPLPNHLDASLVQNAINSYKDVDGLTFINAGRLVQGMPSLVPCTPKGIIDLLDEYKIKIEGSQVVVIGRSVLVGKPIANLLTNRNASVTICHSKTDDISKYSKMADILIVAVGKPHIVTKNMVKDGAIVVDVGINRVDGKILGDVDTDEVVEIAGKITPVPGGVGLTTVLSLLENVVQAAKEQNNII